MQAQLMQLARSLVVLGVLQRTTPGKLDLLQLAAGLQDLQLMQHSLRHGQTLRQLGSNGQLNPVGLHLAMLAAAALASRPCRKVAQAEIPARPVQAIAGSEFQSLHGELITIALAGAQPSLSACSASGSGLSFHFSSKACTATSATAPQLDHGRYPPRHARSPCPAAAASPADSGSAPAATDRHG